MLVAAIAFLVVFMLWRFHNSPVGSVLVAIRENEQRARFLGYATDRYKLIAFIMSAAITGLAGMLLLFNNRMTSAEPISVAFSGELLAMVVIGGMRSFLGPALGALFFVIFRDYLSSLTENWLFVFGLLFVAFIVFSPRGLVGVYEQVTAPFRKKVVEDAAMAARRIGAEPLPHFLRPAEHTSGAILEVRNIVKHFGGIKAVEGASFTVRDRTLHALIGPNGAGKTTAFNLISGMYAPDSGDVAARRKEHFRAAAGSDHASRHRPLVPDHQPVSGTERRGEYPARGAGAPSARFQPLELRARASRRSKAKPRP